MKNNIKAYIYIEVFITLFIVGLIVLPLLLNLVLGLGGLGPERVLIIKVNRMYVDSAGENGSHYMLSSTNGEIFEVDNGLFLGVWNADEIYGNMKEGGEYRITTKGNKVTNFFIQHYPYIVKAEELRL